MEDPLMDRGRHDWDMAAIIMAGGIGTRFWPLSTEDRPKQFLNLFDERSLLQKSYDRIAGLIPDERILVLTNQRFAGLVREQLPQIPTENVIGEPMRRDTAAAVCLGALIGRKRFGNPVIVTLTADHLIEPVAAFQKTLLSAARTAYEKEVLYTFGIGPTEPSTAYGYLELGEIIMDDSGVEHYHVLHFHEKPDLHTAGEYIRSGRYYWNSGMFVWTADAILMELGLHLPDHVNALAEATAYYGTNRWEDALEGAFQRLKPVSIDYGVMEKASDVRCVASTFSWSDVGGWQALKTFLSSDGSGNFCRGQAVCRDSSGNIVFCEEPDETVMLIGVENLVVVRAGNRTLISHADRTEEIKQILHDQKQKDGKKR